MRSMCNNKFKGDVNMRAPSKSIATHALLKGSTVKLSVCSRYEGASFIVVKGLKDARKCAWMGELGQYF